MFPPYLFAYAETLRVEPAVVALRRLAEASGAKLWITGGTLRDVILARWPKDLDLAVDGDPIALGQQLAAEGLATFVPLDPSTGTVRAAIQSTQGITWIDMVALRADDIETDLWARDFSINAIALPLDDSFDAGTGVFIDPTGGRDDLHNRTLRLTTDQAISDDPLRILRGYRLMAQLGFELPPKTRQALQQHAALADRPSAERIVQELAGLLAAPDPSVALSAMMADGVLGAIIPELAKAVGVGQNAYHHLDVWEHTLETVRQMATMVHSPAARADESFDGYLADTANHSPLLWSALLHDVGKPDCRTQVDEAVHFYRHEQVGAKQTAAISKRLRLSKKHQDRITRLVQNHLRPLLLLAQQGPEALTPRAADRLGQAMEDDLAGLFLLAIADTRATQGPAAQKDGEAQLTALWQRLTALREKHILPVDEESPWLTGHDLIHRFGIPEGPLVGEWLAALRDARIEGRINDRQDLKHWLAARLKALHNNSEKES
jgi:poly(A) polymerase